VVSSGALVSRVIPAVVVGVGLLPPSGGLAQEGPVRWHDGSGVLGNGSKVLTSKRMGKSSYL
jgi:hypothetical protein